ncbi:MAG: DUF1015 domain-containing protein [Actinomycetes bacterium]
MGIVEPINALHYDLAKTGGLQPVIAPPYDVIDDSERADLLSRSPHNIVAIDLPKGDDPYAAAAGQLAEWIESGALTRDDEPAVWAVEQTYSAPGSGAKLVRKGFLARIEVEEYGPGKVRPHERTHAGPKEDRLRLTRATKTNLSPIFALYDDPTGIAERALDSATASEPWGEATGYDGAETRVWRVAEPEVVAAVCQVATDSELLIADGHHRYETARVHADEPDAPAGARFTLAYLVALQDPGLVVFPTHRLVDGLTEEDWAALDEAIAENFDVVELDEPLEPSGEGGERVQITLLDSRDGSAKLLTLRDPAIAEQLLPDRSAAYRELDTGVLEALLLRGALGITEERVDHLDGFGYARDLITAVQAVASGERDAAFLMGPTPVTRIRAVAEAGEYMPPKSTYFFPKIPTGILLNPLED